jgi:hypothetical protein
MSWTVVGTERGSCSSRPRARRAISAAGSASFTVTFELGYEILISRIVRVGSL